LAQPAHNGFTRPEVTQEHIARGILDITKKLESRLKKKGWGSYASRHEIFGICAEEMDELLDELRINTPEGYENFAKECLDVAVAGLFGYICVQYGYIHPSKRELEKR